MTVPQRWDTWRISSFSGEQGNCVQAKPDGGKIVVRHSKYPGGARIHYTTDEWKAFIAGVKNGEFDID